MIHVDAVSLLPTPDEMVSWAVDTQPGEYAGHSLPLSGWVLARSPGEVVVEVACAGRILGRFPAIGSRPDVGAAHPDHPRATDVGFEAMIGLLGLTGAFEIAAYVLFGDGTPRPMATLHGRREPLETGFKPSRQPLMLTSTGRTGTHWLTFLLSKHEDIDAYEVFRLEPRMLNYWMSVLNTLSTPSSYLQGVTAADMDSPTWWLGPGGAPLAQPPSTTALGDWFATRGTASFQAYWNWQATPGLRDWMASTYIEDVAQFCQERIEAFYSAVDGDTSRQRARYFIEKNLADPTLTDLTVELYPQAREIILVRDLRDVICSMRAFGRKLGYVGDAGSDGLVTLSELEGVREAGAGLLEAWRRRQSKAQLIRYEDLLSNPSSTIATLLEYLGIPGDDDVAERMVTDAIAEDEERQGSHRTRDDATATIGRWREELAPKAQEDCTEAFREFLVEFGYDTESAA